MLFCFIRILKGWYDYNEAAIIDTKEPQRGGISPLGGFCTSKCFIFYNYISPASAVRFRLLKF